MIKYALLRASSYPKAFTKQDIINSELQQYNKLHDYEPMMYRMTSDEAEKRISNEADELYRIHLESWGDNAPLLIQKVESENQCDFDKIENSEAFVSWKDMS